MHSGFSDDFDFSKEKSEEKEHTDLNELEVDYGDNVDLLIASVEKSIRPEYPADIKADYSKNADVYRNIPEAPSAAASAAAIETERKLDEMKSGLDEKLETLKTMFSTKIMADERKDKIISDMHEELQKHKDDFYAKIFSPLLIDLAMLKEDMHKICADLYKKGGETAPEKILSVMNDFALDIGDILEKYNVELYNCEGERYTPIKQKIAKILETDDPELDGKICERLSCGYALHGKILRPERVTAFKYKKYKNDNGGEQ